MKPKSKFVYLPTNQKILKDANERITRMNSEAREWRQDSDKTQTNKLEWMILKISLRARAGVPKTLVKKKLCLHSLYLVQNTLMLTEPRGEFSDLHSIFYFFFCALLLRTSEAWNALLVDSMQVSVVGTGRNHMFPYFWNVTETCNSMFPLYLRLAETCSLRKQPSFFAPGRVASLGRERRRTAVFAG